MEASGFVTAGGRSSRMGTDKAWLDLGGKSIIERVIAALAPVASSIRIIANDPGYERLGLPVVADENPGVGPLEAIRVALKHSTSDRALLVGCDMPFVTSELFTLLLSIDQSCAAVVPLSREGLPEPLCAVYSRQALDDVSDLIAAGARKVSDLFDIVPAHFMAFEQLAHLAGSDLFFQNINTPQEYVRARELFG